MLTSILITGGDGVIGWHLVEKLSHTGYDVIATSKGGKVEHASRSFVLDVLDRGCFHTLPKNVDVIIHTAAVSRVGVAEADPAFCFKVNVEGTLNLVEWSFSLKRPLFVFLSSREVYGEPLYTPVDEHHPTNPISAYGISKLMAELVLRNRKLYGLHYAIVRLTNVFGSTRDYSSRVIPAFISNALKGDPLIIHGGDQILDFIHINDVLEGILRLIETYESERDRILGSTFNLCSGKGFSLIEIAEFIIRKTKSKSSIKIEKAKPYETRRFIGDNRRAQSLIGAVPKVEFKVGLIEYIEKMKNLIKDY